MELVRVKLGTLLQLIALSQKELAAELRIASSSSQQPSQASGTLKKLLSETIQYLAFTISSSRDAQHQKQMPSLRALCSQQELAKMAQVKAALEDLRYSLGRPTSEGALTLPEIRAELEALARLCLNEREKEQIGSPQRERSYSTRAEYFHLLARPPRNHEPFVPRRESEAERTARLRAELQKEMD